MARREWRAMGTDVSVLVVGDDADELERLAELAVDRVDELERRWSRFIDDSEISRLNAEPGHPYTVTDETLLLVATSVDAWSVTGGRFDPTVGDAVIAAGYDRSFDDLAGTTVSARPAPVPTVSDDGRRVDAGAVAVDHGRHTVTLPVGVRFDAGGLGKGLAADLVARELIEAGAAGACVNLGGDVRVLGASPDDPVPVRHEPSTGEPTTAEPTSGEPTSGEPTSGEPTGEAVGWSIGIADPFDPDRDLAVVRLVDGAVATSSTLRRRWKVAGDPGDPSAPPAEAHHVIDPATGRSTATDVAVATVIAANAATCEALATAAIVGGADAGAALIEGMNAAGLLIAPDGTRRPVGAFADFLAGELS